MILVKAPGVGARSAVPYLGIRTRTPMKGMFAEVEKLKKELAAWLKTQGIQAAGPSFLRYHVIDMSGLMDIEVGTPTSSAEGSDRVHRGVLPAGRYASLVYVGHGLTGNKALLQWIEDQGLLKDRWDEPEGDAFACRTEAYLTDPRTEPKKMKWEIELSIKLV